VDLVNEKVLHGTFGKGNVISCDEEYIKIDFDSGRKKFVFPDAFKKYMTLADEEAFKFVKSKIQENEDERIKKESQLKQERALSRERQRVLEQKQQIKKVKTHPELQSVFWCKDGEEKQVFTEWRVSTGNIKNGENKGQPRSLARMDQKSACLLTKRESDLPEKRRRILGVFMVATDFNGKSNEDGYIPAHPDYRIELSKEESEKMSFWNYYSNKKLPKTTIWNSGRQRYFDNIWMAQILKDIVSLKEDLEEKQYAQRFLEYFCKVNLINVAELPEADGPLRSK